MERCMQSKNITWTDILAIVLRSVIVFLRIWYRLANAKSLVDVVSDAPPSGDASCIKMLGVRCDFEASPVFSYLTRSII